MRAVILVGFVALAALGFAGSANSQSITGGNGKTFSQYISDGYEIKGSMSGLAVGNVILQKGKNTVICFHIFSSLGNKFPASIKTTACADLE